MCCGSKYWLRIRYRYVLGEDKPETKEPKNNERLRNTMKGVMIEYILKCRGARFLGKLCRNDTAKT